MFSSQQLILTSDGAWRATEVFLNADENHVPGAAVIHEDLRQLTLWQKIGVPERPTVEGVLAWLTSLPRDAPLAPEDLRRIKEILRSNPQRIWTECGCWLNLEGEWVPVGDLVYYISTEPAAHSAIFSPLSSGKSPIWGACRRELFNRHPFPGFATLQTGYRSAFRTVPHRPCRGMQALADRPRERLCASCG